MKKRWLTWLVCLMVMTLPCFFAGCNNTESHDKWITHNQLIATSRVQIDDVQGLISSEEEQRTQYSSLDGQLINLLSLSTLGVSDYLTAAFLIEDFERVGASFGVSKGENGSFIIEFSETHIELLREDRVFDYNCKSREQTKKHVIRFNNDLTGFSISTTIDGVNTCMFEYIALENGFAIQTAYFDEPVSTYHVAELRATDLSNSKFSYKLRDVMGNMPTSILSRLGDGFATGSGSVPIG